MLGRRCLAHACSILQRLCQLLAARYVSFWYHLLECMCPFPFPFPNLPPAQESLMPGQGLSLPPQRSRHLTCKCDRVCCKGYQACPKTLCVPEEKGQNRLHHFSFLHLTRSCNFGV